MTVRRRPGTKWTLMRTNMKLDCLQYGHTFHMLWPIPALSFDRTLTKGQHTECSKWGRGRDEMGIHGIKEFSIAINELRYTDQENHYH